MMSFLCLCSAFRCLREPVFGCPLHFPWSFARIIRNIPYLCADKRCRFGTLMNIPGGLPQPYHAV